jgi:hypothetical protein
MRIKAKLQEPVQPQDAVEAAPPAEGGVHKLRCIYLNLDARAIEFDETELEIHRVESVDVILPLLKRWNFHNCCILVGISRNLMTNYLAIAALFFRDERADVPVILVTHSGNKIAEYKAFLFGKKPYPFRRITREAVQNMIEVQSYNLRGFTRIPVEFIAFADPEAGGEQIPVVCKNISWGGTYMETREEFDFRRFTLILRSQLHTIEIPCRIQRRSYIPTPPPRYGYGVQFLMPLPLSLVHYMYAKYLKDQGENL